MGGPERRAAWTGFSVLLTIIAGHTMLETARDTLFLRDLPATQLPWAYLGIAGASFLAGIVGGGARTGMSQRRLLRLTLVAGAVGTGAFWFLTAPREPAALLLLYVWTGLLASLVVMRVWLFLAEQVDLVQAKRIYPYVAAGGLAGATAGALLATGVVEIAPPRALLLGASSLYLVAALLARGEPVARTAQDAPPGPSALAALGHLRTDRYLRRVVAVAFIAPIVFTAIDFLFKSAVSREVPPAALGGFFARYYGAVYGAALLLQLAVAPRLLRGLGVVRGLLLLPVLLLLGATGFAVTGGFLAALALKGTDVALRHSLHRASTEILFLPVASAMRAPIKALADGLATRTGQALGSLALLLAVRHGLGLHALAAATAGLLAVWIAAIGGLRSAYVDRFRATLRERGGEAEAEVPELDLHSLEALVAALGSSSDAEVIAALDILTRYGRSALVSPFILYHPSAAVVRRALELFSGSTRDDVELIRRRLLEHGEPEIRAAALRGLSVGDGDHATLLRLVRDPAPEVRATALAVVVGRRGEITGREAESLASEILGAWPPTARAALARTFGHLPAAVVARLARTLANDADPTVRAELARALAEAPTVDLLDVYTSLIAFRESRELARQTLVALGAPALRHLGEALGATETPIAVRVHVPRSVSRFQSAEAAALLVAALRGQREPRVRYKILRGLGRMRASDPALPIEREPLVAEADAALRRAIAVLHYGVAAEVSSRLGRDRGPGPRRLLRALLREKERRALERVFRILHILEPTEQYRGMFHGLSDADPHLRAASRELLEHVLDERAVRAGILAMTEPAPPPARLKAALAFFAPDGAARLLELAGAGRTPEEPPDLRELLDAAWSAMQADRDPVLAAIAGWELAMTRPAREPASEEARAHG